MHNIKIKIKEKISDFIAKKYPNWDLSTALRYLPIVEDLKKRLNDKTKILEVGPGEFGILPYLKSYSRRNIKITGVDIDFGNRSQKNLIMIDGRADKLPFKNGSFDIVICVDTLEHLQKRRRKAAIYEIVRVAKSHAYVAFPRGNLSRMVDLALSKYYQYTHKKRLEFLEEHVHFDLPEEGEVLKNLNTALSNYRKRAEIKRFGNTTILLWFFLLILGFSEVRFLTSWYHRLLLLIPALRFINFWPAYRAMIFVYLK